MAWDCRDLGRGATVVKKRRHGVPRVRAAVGYIGGSGGGVVVVMAVL
jgi:hypothetical protein